VAAAAQLVSAVATAFPSPSTITSRTWGGLGAGCPQRRSRTPGQRFRQRVLANGNAGCLRVVASSGRAGAVDGVTLNDIDGRGNAATMLLLRSRETSEVLLFDLP